MVVNIRFASGISNSDPNNEVVLVVGKKEHLEKLSGNIGLLSVKFGDVINAQHFAKGVKKLSYHPTDIVDLWFKNFMVASLPSIVSRHNAPMSPHALTLIAQNSLAKSTKESVVEVNKVGKEIGILPTVIQGKELDEKGFGGLYGVGKAAIHQPALVILSHTPAGATKTIAWCGKGIVYDTGGLSIKDKNNMPGMKRDCGGAAGILGAFRTAVKMGFKENLHAVFCLAENAVGPLATRPDDVHTLYSGLTVEINNTDAEGRLVLGDGVAYAKKDLKAEIIIDMATLTGAQGIATGKYHAAILSNNEEWENRCVKAGKMSGDLVFPVPYCPELHFEEFNSHVADMKNSVKSRSNAQVSCAGLFIGAHIGFDFSGVWVHIDMAAPVELQNERGSGYGVALLLTLFGKYSNNDLLQKISPDL